MNRREAIRKALLGLFGVGASITLLNSPKLPEARADLQGGLNMGGVTIANEQANGETVRLERNDSIGDPRQSVLRIRPSTYSGWPKNRVVSAIELRSDSTVYKIDSLGKPILSPYAGWDGSYNHFQFWYERLIADPTFKLDHFGLFNQYNNSDPVPVWYGFKNAVTDLTNKFIVICLMLDPITHYPTKKEIELVDSNITVTVTLDGTPAQNILSKTVDFHGAKLTNYVL